METEYIGNMIAYERNRRGLTAEVVHRGICEQSVYSRIENGNYTKSSNENILKFRDYLNDNGIVATVRRELGSDIEAACGQLRRKNIKDKEVN